MMAERVKKAGGRTTCRRVGTGTRTEQGSSEPPLRPSQCRAYMRRTLAREFRAIVDGFIEEAKTGSCQHVKLATELMKPVTKKSTGSKDGGKGMVQELLERLEREEQLRGSGKL